MIAVVAVPACWSRNHETSRSSKRGYRFAAAGRYLLPTVVDSFRKRQFQKNYCCGASTKPVLIPIMQKKAFLL